MNALRRDMLRLDHTGFARLPSSLQGIWVGLLAGAGTVASAAFACATPFAAVAMLAAATLPLRKALAVTLALWLGNQIVGFVLLDYPWNGETLAWGIIIGAASAAAIFVAHRVTSITIRQTSVMRPVILFVAAFATYQAGLLLGSAIVPAHGGLALDIVATVAVINAAWAIGLGVGYLGLRMVATVVAVPDIRRRA